MANSNTIMIRVESNGTTAVANMKQTGDQIVRETERIGKSTDVLNNQFKMLAIPTTAILSVYALGSAITTSIGGSIKYLSTIETANLGIASAFMTSGKYIDETTGKALKGEAALRSAQQDAKKIMGELQVANMQTIATLDELVRAYQETLPVAMAKGFNKEQVKEFTVAMVQAAGAIGLPMNQMGEETRSMLTGAIDPRTSRIATVLGLRNEDIRQHQQNAGQLFSFLMGKLEAYRVAGMESQKTWAGITSNTKDVLLQMGGQAFQPLFEAVKYELTEITKGLVTIDEKTQKIVWSQEFLDQIDTIKNGITNVIAEAYRLSMLLDKAGGTWTSIGMLGAGPGSAMGISRKDHPVLATLFGSKEEFEEYARRNMEYEQRYLNSDKKLQALAYRMAGLDENGKPIKNGPTSPYQQNPTSPDTKAEEKARKAAEKARKDQDAISQVLAGMRDRDLMIGKEKDEKELIQLEQKHRQELKQLRDHHASAAQLAEAARLQADEKADLSAQQRLEKARALAMAEVQITEKKIEEQAAWQQKLDDYQVKTGGMNEETAIARRYERERQILATKQNTLAVQIKQGENDARRLEMEEQYWTLQRQIENSAVAEAQETAIAAANLYAAYADINIQLKEMVGNLEDAARARQKLFWDSATGQALINDAMAGKPGAADAYWAQENMDRMGLQQARLQDPVNGSGGMKSQMAMSGLDPYTAQTQKLQEAYQERLRIADNYYAASAGKEREHAALVEQINREHSTKMKKVEQDRWIAAAATVATYMGQMANELMQGNKRQFEIGKRMAQATAAIQGALAIIQAYGQLGPIAGTVAAVVIGAVTIAQIAKIDSQEYQAARALGGSVEAGRSYLVGENGREVFTPDSSGTITPNRQIGGKNNSMNVTVVQQISTGVSDTVRAELMRATPYMQQMAISAVMQAMRNGDFQDVI